MARSIEGDDDSGELDVVAHSCPVLVPWNMGKIRTSPAKGKTPTSPTSPTKVTPQKGRRSKGKRSQRAVRLSLKQEAMLLQLADIRGIDLNAAISVAIAEDWRRWFGGDPTRPGAQ